MACGCGTEGFNPVDRSGIQLLDRAPVSEQVDELFAANHARLSRHAATAQAPFVEALSDLGRLPSYVSTVAPLVFVELSKREILEVAARTDVDRIYPPYL